MALAAIAFAGAVIFGVSGFGSALVTIPLATHLVDLPFALAMFSILDFTNALRVGLADPQSAVAEEWKPILPMIVVGTVLGMTLLIHLPRAATMVALGVFILAVAISNLRRGAAVGLLSRHWGRVAGVAGGITSTLFGAGGPPYAIYLSRRGLTNAQFRATLGRCTMFSIGLRIVAFMIGGLLWTPRPWLWALAVLPVSLIGLWVAGRVFRRVSRDLLVRVIGVMLVGSGASLILRGLS